MDPDNQLPAVCDKCLGPESNIKMLRNANGAACKLCGRPFTVFMWKPVRSLRHLKTIVCQTCSNTKNCCQSCMLDIHYGIPLDVRDAALKMAGVDALYLTSLSSTKNDEIRAMRADKQEKKQLKQDDNELVERAKDILSKLAEKFGEPGLENKLTNRKKTASSSTNSPKVDVSKYVNQLPFSGVITPAPEDETVCSFFIFGLDPNIPQYLVSDYCQKYGPLNNITVIHRCGCGFISFKNRSDAEKFAESINQNGLNSNKVTAGLVILDKYPVRVSWSPVKALPVNRDEQTKLSMVVGKAMKQLADRDRESKMRKQDGEMESEKRKRGGIESKKRKLTGEVDKKDTKRGSRTEKEKKPHNSYKAISDDFEL